MNGDEQDALEALQPRLRWATLEEAVLEFNFDPRPFLERDPRIASKLSPTRIGANLVMVRYYLAEGGPHAMTDHPAACKAVPE